MSRVKFCSALFFAAATIILAATFAAAQATTGSIYGQLTDPSAAVVVDASVTAGNQQTGVSYAGRSDAQGNYAVFGLPPGVYDVTVRRDGFDAASIKSIRI